MLFAGTVATYGRGRAVVVATGMQTEVGKIAGLLEAAEKEPTPLQQELDRTGKRLTVVMLGICALVFAAGLFSAKAFTLNVVLEHVPVRGRARGRRHPGSAAGDRDDRLEPRRAADGCGQCHRPQAAGDRDARRRHRHLLGQDRHAHAQRDDGARDLLRRLGRRGRRQRLHPGRRLHLRRQAARRRSSIHRGLEQTLIAAALVNDAALTNGEGRWTVQGDPTEGALVVAARKFGITEQSLAKHRRVAEIPFTSERKRHTTVHADPDKPGELRIMVKGAPEILLSRCRYVMQQGQPIALSEARASIAKRNDALASQALRVLAIATRTMPAATLGIDLQMPASTSSCRKRSRRILSCSDLSA